MGSRSRGNNQIRKDDNKRRVVDCRKRHSGRGFNGHDLADASIAISMNSQPGGGAFGTACTGTDNELPFLPFKKRAKLYLAVVRHAEVKYRRPAAGELTAKAEVSPEEAERFRTTLERRGRGAIEVHVQVVDSDEAITLEASFEWFAQGVRPGVS
jgi:hypothetical protein